MANTTEGENVIASGFLGNLTSTQMDALTEIKSRVSDYLQKHPEVQPSLDYILERDKNVGENPDVHFLQFLRARYCGIVLWIEV